MTPDEKAQDPLAGVRCQGSSKQSGERCRRRPIPGGFVCVMHGGKAPTVREKARQRIESLLPLGLRRLGQLAKQKSEPGVALGAVREIIKLNELEPVQKVDATVSYRWQRDDEAEPAEPTT